MPITTLTTPAGQVGSAWTSESVGEPLSPPAWGGGESTLEVAVECSSHLARLPGGELVLESTGELPSSPGAQEAGGEGRGSELVSTEKDSISSEDERHALGVISGIKARFLCLLAAVCGT